MAEKPDPLAHAAHYGQGYRKRSNNLHPTGTVSSLREAFCGPLPETGSADDKVITDLIAAAEPGLVGNTDPNFYAWVMGGSDPVGVAADWLTSIWGQNAGIFQTSPAAAIAEEAVEAWLLDLLDLPRQCSVGLVTGATMAAFVGLAAARSEVLRRAGHDFEALGLQNAPFVHVYHSDDVHITNLTALRHLGFGECNFHRLPSDEAGLAAPETYAQAMAQHAGPKIIITQAGHINSGGFEDFTAITEIARSHGAWVHVDGAFGLWARAANSTRHLARGADLADSWSVDGHKWLQIPYDSGFAIVKDANAHRRAMQITASYLTHTDKDGRNPTNYGPELSRRARGFAAWAVIRHLGREGVAELIERHCKAAARLAERLRAVDGLTVVNAVDLNQVIVASTDGDPSRITALADALNDKSGTFVRTDNWKGRTVLRLSVISNLTTPDDTSQLSNHIETLWRNLAP